MVLFRAYHLDEVIAVALLEPAGSPMKISEPEKGPDAAIIPPATNGNGGERIGRVN